MRFYGLLPNANGRNYHMSGKIKYFSPKEVDIRIINGKRHAFVKDAYKLKFPNGEWRYFTTDDQEAVDMNLRQLSPVQRERISVFFKRLPGETDNDHDIRCNKVLTPDDRQWIVEFLDEFHKGITAQQH